MSTRTPHITPLPYRPENYSAAWWHLARLDLRGFMVQHKDELPQRLVAEARSLYGTHDRARLNPEKYGHLSSIYGRGRIRRIV